MNARYGDFVFFVQSLTCSNLHHRNEKVPSNQFWNIPDPDRTKPLNPDDLDIAETKIPQSVAVRVAKCFMYFFNALALLVGLAELGAGIYIYAASFLQKFIMSLPVISGLALAILAAIGLVGTKKQTRRYLVP